MILPAVRKIFWLTVLGVATVLLIGPVVAVVGTVLPFTLVGVLVWGAWKGAMRLAQRLHLHCLREKIVHDEVLPVVARHAGQAVRQGVHQCKVLGPAMCSHVRRGFHHCQAFAPAMCAQGWHVGRQAAGLACRAARMIVEITCGAAVGGLVAWYALGANEPTTIMTGALVGGALGFVIGGPKPKAAQEQIALE